MARPRTGAQQQRGGGGFAQKGGAMSFHEIGKLEGLTHSGGAMVFQRGIRKLKQNHPLFLAVMMELAEELSCSRAMRRPLYENQELDA